MPDETREALRELRREPGEFAVPYRHPLVFTVVCLPEIVSLVVATLIYRFSPVYVISLVWYCLTGMFLIHGIYEGQLTDNHGTAVRQKTPIRFWLKVSVWGIGCLFALASPVLFALQERGREKAAEPAPAQVTTISRSEAEAGK